MAKRYDPILCMMVEDNSVKTHDEPSLSQKKQVVTELKGFLKKSYNFSNESEYARAYEDLRHMFTTGSKKSLSGLFENAVKKTGGHDSNSVNKTIDKAIRTFNNAKDASFITYNEIKSVYNLISNALMYRGNEGKMVNLLEKAQSELLSIASKTK